jgi:two-component system sensor histidine kinase/response regulator
MKTILLIDDDQAVLSTFSLALGRHGFRVITASAGEEGLCLARRHFPDLVLCDVNMPGTDGRTVLQILREDPDLAAKQFVLITGNTPDLTPRIGMELGADDFLVKPFSVDALIRCIEARLRRADVHGRVAEAMVRQLRSSLRSTLPHEFFTPLAGILGLVDVLRMEIAQFRPGEIQEILDDIERSGQRLHRTLKNYLFILDLDSVKTHSSADLELSAAQARQLLASAAGYATNRHQRSGDISISVEDSPLLRLPPDLAAIVEELVDNACSYSRTGTPILVQLSATGMIVTDRGRGMTADEIQQIAAFRQFDRKKYEQQGLGLGLVVVQKLATRNGIQFKIKSEPGKSTEAALTFNANVSPCDGGIS